MYSGPLSDWNQCYNFAPHWTNRKFVASNLAPNRRVLGALLSKFWQYFVQQQICLYFFFQLINNNFSLIIRSNFNYNYKYCYYNKYWHYNYIILYLRTSRDVSWVSGQLSAHFCATIANSSSQIWKMKFFFLNYIPRLYIHNF